MEEEILRRLEAIRDERQARVTRTEGQLNGMIAEGAARDAQDRADGEEQLRRYREELDEIEFDLTIYSGYVFLVRNRNERDALQARIKDAQERIDRTEGQLNGTITDGVARDDQDREEGSIQLAAYRAELSNLESQLSNLNNVISTTEQFFMDIERRYGIDRDTMDVSQNQNIDDRANDTAGNTRSEEPSSADASDTLNDEDRIRAEIADIDEKINAANRRYQEASNDTRISSSQRDASMAEEVDRIDYLNGLKRDLQAALDARNGRDNIQSRTTEDAPEAESRVLEGRGQDDSRASSIRYIFRENNIEITDEQVNELASNGRVQIGDHVYTTEYINGANDYGDNVATEFVVIDTVHRTRDDSEPSRDNDSQDNARRTLNGRGIDERFSRERDIRRIFDDNGIDITDEQINELSNNRVIKIGDKTYSLEFINGGANGYDDGPVTEFQIVEEGAREKDTSEPNRSTDSNPEPAKPEPEPKKPDPEPAKLDPEPKKPEPEPAKPDPEQKKPDPDKDPLERDEDGNLKYPPVHIGDDKYPPARIPKDDKYPPVKRTPMEPSKGLVEVPEVSIEKTGLEIFREQFNQMPDLKGVHALSENPFLKLPAALAPAAATIAMTGGMAAIPVLIGTGVGVAVYSVSKPVLKLITGQAKKEKQIQAQLEDVEKLPPEEFDKMMKYLSEETIITLKPHCAILNAMQKAARTRFGQERAQLNQERADLDAKVEQLSQIKNRTPEQNAELAVLESRISEIDGRIDEMQKMQKDLKRGTQRKSAEYQGNLKGSKLMNLLARRNHSSKVYGQALNEYADADRARVEEMAFAEAAGRDGNVQEAAERAANAAVFGRMKRDVLQKASKSRLGVHLGALNAGTNNTEARVVSDQHDRKIETIGILATMAAGLYRTIHTMKEMVGVADHNAAEAQKAAQQHNSQISQQQSQSVGNNVTFSDSDLRQASAAEAASRANAGEMTNVHTYGTVSHTNAGYVAADAQVNSQATNELNAINSANTSNLSISQRIRMLASQVRATGAAEDYTAKAMGSGFVSQGGVPHFDQTTLMGMAKDGKNIEANLLEQLADILDQTIQTAPGKPISVNPQYAKMDYLGPIMTALGGGIGLETMQNKARRESSWTRSQRQDSGNQR